MKTLCRFERAIVAPSPLDRCIEGGVVGAAGRREVAQAQSASVAETVA